MDRYSQSIFLDAIRHVSDGLLRLNAESMNERSVAVVDTDPGSARMRVKSALIVAVCGKFFW